MTKPHTFHIPVLGIGFTIDTPLKVAPYGMDSVISLSDDILLERLRKMYSEKFNLAYKEITNKIEDYRAKRITEYLNLMNTLVEKKFEEFKATTLEKGNGIKEYLNMLPNGSQIKQEFKNFTDKYVNLTEVKGWLKDNLSMGSIDVNIMSKVDKENYNKEGKLPIEYNDAHAALRGYANSNLTSSVVISAGMSPRLYGYMENFEDFYPNENGEIKKKIIIKVSDYRSALVQGKFLAKKGIWVSEYRIESGLNCGGHAFATDGFLMGPILAEFRDNRESLTQEVFEILAKTLANKNRTVPNNILPIKVTAQGGVGTTEEHEFLIDHYNVDSVGWGTPFMLVPEATNVDEPTIEKLIDAKEKDLYLSDISPLGVPFNNLRDNTQDITKAEFIAKGRPGSSCPKKLLALSKTKDGKNVCTASREYQYTKIKELDQEGLAPDVYQNRFSKIVEKACICVGLGTSVLKVNGMSTKIEGEGISVCPGPNMAYFSKKMSLKEMTDHIYGRTNVITRTDRPHMFVKEMNIYIDYLKNKLQEVTTDLTVKQEKYFTKFVTNLNEGANYYSSMFSGLIDKFEDTKEVILDEIEIQKQTLNILRLEIENLSLKPVMV